MILIYILIATCFIGVYGVFIGLRCLLGIYFHKVPLAILKVPELRPEQVEEIQNYWVSNKFNSKLLIMENSSSIEFINDDGTKQKLEEYAINDSNIQKRKD